VDTGPLDDVLSNVQSTSQARQFSRSSGELYRKHDVTETRLAPVLVTMTSSSTVVGVTTTTGSGVFVQHSQFKSEPDIPRRGEGGGAGGGEWGGGGGAFAQRLVLIVL